MSPKPSNSLTSACSIASVGSGPSVTSPPAPESKEMYRSSMDEETSDDEIMLDMLMKLLLEIVKERQEERRERRESRERRRIERQEERRERQEERRERIETRKRRRISSDEPEPKREPEPKPEPSPSVADALAKLDSMPDLVPGTPEYSFARSMVINNSTKRMILMLIPNNAARLNWIEFMCEEKQKKK